MVVPSALKVRAQCGSKRGTHDISSTAPLSIYTALLTSIIDPSIYLMGFFRFSAKIFQPRRVSHQDPRSRRLYLSSVPISLLRFQPANASHFVPTCDILSNELLSSDSQNHIILLHISAGRSNSYPKPEEHPVISQTLGSILQVLVDDCPPLSDFICRNNGDDLKS